jgi:hypothetical protein
MGLLKKELEMEDFPESAQPIADPEPEMIDGTVVEETDTPDVSETYENPEEKL